MTGLAPSAGAPRDAPALPRRRDVFFAALLAALLAAGYHLLFGDLNLNLRDEGYLWYGVEALLRGELPLRDFQAYDPGRYVWCALWSPVFGSGILGVRAAAAVFQALGLFAGLLAVRRVVPRAAWLVPAGLVLLLWSFPRHKVFEPAITLMAVLVGARLLEVPSVRRSFWSGAFVGLMAFFGRNHGLYLGAAFLGLIGFAYWKLREPGLPRRLAAFGGGVATGYAPMLGMLAFAPGYARAFLHALLSVSERGTNLPKAYPWPWREDWGALAGYDVLGTAGLSVAFLLAPLLLPVGFWLALRARSADLGRLSVAVAASFVGLVYVHHVWVRSDLPHLAQSIHPVLVLALALPLALGRASARVHALVSAGLVALTGVVVLQGHPELKRYKPGAERHDLVPYDAAGETLRLKFAQDRHLVRVETLIARFVEPEEPLFIAPTIPTLYPLLHKRSPTWWIYFLWPATEDEQRETIRRLDEGGVNWALIVEKPFDHQEEFNFRETNPLVWRHLNREFQRVVDVLVPPDYYLFRR